MKIDKNHITVFEHDPLWTHKGDQRITDLQLKQLQIFSGDKGVPYYEQIHNGIRFKEYVGVIRVGGLTIEVLPKADKSYEKAKWQKTLIGMLRAVNAFNIHAPSESSLNTKTNFILDLYFELFVKETEYLFNKGLIKKYRREENNSLSLKGSLLFSKHISRNLVHQERFYVRRTTYDNVHLLHQILFKTLLLLKDINTNTSLSSRIGSLLLNFPKTKDFKVTEAAFRKINFIRKTLDYKNSIEISRLLLLNYHPGLSNGQSDILALMFDMNLLWEKFIYISLRKYLPKDMVISAQTTKYFWRPEKGYGSTMRPDIVLTWDKETYVLDTKWKNIGDSNPSPNDLRQLYVYHEYYEAEKVALIYPGVENLKKGNYYDTQGNGLSAKECGLISIPSHKSITNGQEEIKNQIYGNWLGVGEY
ncbi:MAG: restriction endonuclease [Chlorobi bacterium]|nr:restriction endonuclease [Chlorobiota bacterium]